jgi:hypothetical protein
MMPMKAAWGPGLPTTKGQAPVASRIGFSRFISASSSPAITASGTPLRWILEWLGLDRPNLLRLRTLGEFSARTSMTFTHVACRFTPHYVRHRRNLILGGLRWVALHGSYNGR